MNISIIVTDSSPLITLAIAGELDVLLLPKLKVLIPDMVRFEVIRYPEKQLRERHINLTDAEEGKDEGSWNQRMKP